LLLGYLSSSCTLVKVLREERYWEKEIIKCPCKTVKGFDYRVLKIPGNPFEKHKTMTYVLQAFFGDCSPA
jgi:hypothetical protein